MKKLSSKSNLNTANLAIQAFDFEATLQRRWNGQGWDVRAYADGDELSLSEKQRLVEILDLSGYDTSEIR